MKRGSKKVADYIIPQSKIKLRLCRTFENIVTHSSVKRLCYNENLLRRNSIMITLEDFGKLELRIAEILSVTTHPQADRLWVLRIRIGDTERTIVAGIRLHYSESELVGKKIVVIANLAPAQIRGVTSEGMLLAASTDQTLTLVVPERGIPSGAKVK